MAAASCPASTRRRARITCPPCFTSCRVVSRPTPLLTVNTGLATEVLGPWRRRWRASFVACLSAVETVGILVRSRHLNGRWRQAELAGFTGGGGSASASVGSLPYARPDSLQHRGERAMSQSKYALDPGLRAMLTDLRPANVLRRRPRGRHPIGRAGAVSSESSSRSGVPSRSRPQIPTCRCMEDVFSPEELALRSSLR